MKAWYKIHDKPRGRWRPLMEWGVHFTPNETDEAEALNLNREIEYCFRGLPSGVGAPACSQKGTAVAFLPERPYTKRSKKIEEDYRVGYNFGFCSSCPVKTIDSMEEHWRSHDNLIVPDECWRVRLPWRPGARPDYSDFIETIRGFLRQVLEELDRRFQEAHESAPSDEWLLEEEFDSFSWRTTDNGTEVAERKLRVIRR